MNIIRKCEFLVNENDYGEVIQFFFATIEIDLDQCEQSESSGRFLVPGLIGFDLYDNTSFGLSRWWIRRVATYEERQTFLRWMTEHGIRFNQNTLEIRY